MSLHALLMLAAKKPSEGGGGTPIAFVDDFNDGTIDTTKWTVNQSGGVNASETGGQLLMTPTPNTVGAVDMRSPSMNFTGKVVEWQIDQVLGGEPFTAGYNYTQIRVEKDSNNFVAFDLSGSHPFRYGGFGVWTAGVSDYANYGASAWSYLGQRARFAFSGGNVTLALWNGSFFQTQESKAVSWDITALQISLISGYWGTGNSSTQAGAYDNIVSDATYIP